MLSKWISKENNVPIYVIAVSLAVWQRVTVKKGQTLNLSCPITNAHKNNVDWRNPEGYIMFFNQKKGEGEWLTLCNHTNKCASSNTVSDFEICIWYLIFNIIVLFIFIMHIHFQLWMTGATASTNCLSQNSPSVFPMSPSKMEATTHALSTTTTQQRRRWRWQC